ncbi:MAG: DnaB-like helicase C-terminal domain-containing protein [Planctomycetota bacterium]
MIEEHQCQDFEQATLGTMLLAKDSSVLDEIRSEVDADDFENKKYRELFELISNLIDLGKPVNDIKLVTAEIVRRKMDLTQGDIASLFTSVPHCHHARFYAEQVKEAAQKIRLSKSLSEAQDQILGPDSFEQVVKRLSAEFQKLTSRGRVELRTAEDLIAAYTSVDRSQKPIMTGIEKFDDNFGGLFPGELVLIGARLGSGKTALAWQILVHNIKRLRHCLFVSLEMTTRSLYERHLAAELSISPRRIRNDDLTDEQRHAIEEENERFACLPVSVYAPPRATVQQIAAAAKLKASGEGLSMLFVDYFTKIQPSGKSKDRREELIQISGEMKALALELEIPVVLLAQLNRASDEGIPRPSQLAECDELGRDADQILLLHRKKDTTDLRVAKHRFVEDNVAIELSFKGGKFFQADNTWNP